jgi:alkylated DNA nucleotide flippase Atl1
LLKKYWLNRINTEGITMGKYTIATLSDGRKMTHGEIARIAGVTHHAIDHRVRTGRPEEEWFRPKRKVKTREVEQPTQKKKPFVRPKGWGGLG